MKDQYLGKPLKAIVEQLEACKFVDEIGHPLENNMAFLELKRRADEELKDGDKQCKVQ